MSRAVCSPNDPRLACDGRRNAGLRGEFYWAHRRGWRWTAFAERGYWKACPWCEGPLPSEDDVYGRIIAALEEEDE